MFLWPGDCGRAPRLRNNATGAPDLLPPQVQLSRPYKATTTHFRAETTRRATDLQRQPSRFFPLSHQRACDDCTTELAAQQQQQDAERRRSVEKDAKKMNSRRSQVTNETTPALDRLLLRREQSTSAHPRGLHSGGIPDGAILG